MKGEMISMGYVDPTFSLNNFNRPKVLSKMETYVNNFLMLLFGKPGFYPSIPEIGMDIEQYLYQFEDDINTDEIKTKLVKQCEEFLPEIQSGTFNVLKSTYKNNTLLVFVMPIIDDTQTHSVAIGITRNTKGELIYKFVENMDQTL